ncbi:MAG: hypothetical protein EA398_08695 [Deltaproteobacteria bacterium]|nr:MAG: hypothetical protein EA398_08695 [Deltaproteobacteria bacterium]
MSEGMGSRAGAALPLGLVVSCVLLLAIACGGDPDDAADTVVSGPTPTSPSDEPSVRTDEPSTPGTEGAGGGGSSSGAASGSDGACFDLTGRWEGSYESQAGLAGDALVFLEQEGCTVTGQSVFTDAPCFSEANVRGSLAPSDGDTWIFSGELYGQTSRGQELLMDVSGPVDASLSPPTGSFSYVVVAGGLCTGNTGLITIERP